MTLTPLDIHNKEFKVGFRGYVEGEVDDFLDQVVKEFESLIRENGELKDRLDNLDQALERYRTIEDSLNKTLLLAQQAAEEVRSVGGREAELIRERALMEAKRMVDEAKAQARQAVEDYSEMRREAELFRLRMKTMLQAQLEIFIEAEAKEEESGTTPFATGAKAAGITTRYAAGDRESDPSGYGPAPREDAAALDYRRPAPEPDHRRPASEPDYRRPAPAPAETGETGRPNLWGEPATSARSLPTRRSGQSPAGQRPGEAEAEGEDEKGW
jgi:cell division initiation protein